MAVYAIEWVSNPYGPPQVRYFPEDASQSFKKGDPVRLDTSGQVQIAVDTSTFYGIALENASGTENTSLAVLVISAHDIFSASQSNAGATQVTAQTQVGLLCSWRKSTVTGETNKTVVDTADTTDTSIEIIDLDAKDAVGASDGRVLFRFSPLYLAFR